MDESDYKKKLTVEQYRVMRERGTEPAFAGVHWNKDEHGTYSCAACGTALFRSGDKVDKETGWPTFTRPIDEASLQCKKEADQSGEREMRCAECKSHIGRLLRSGKYRVYSAALNFTPSNRIEIFEDVKDKVEKVQDAVDQPQNKDDPFDSAQGRQPYSLSPALSSTYSFAQLLGGGVFGLVVGAAGAFLICEASCGAPQNLSFTSSATTTTSVISATSSAPTSSDREPTPEPTPAPAPAQTSPTNNVPEAPSIITPGTPSSTGVAE